MGRHTNFMDQLPRSTRDDMQAYRATVYVTQW